MSDVWRSVLRRPERYRLTTPTGLVTALGASGRWLADRYLA
jgi:hypothetical protein